MEGRINVIYVKFILKNLPFSPNFCFFFALNTRYCCAHLRPLGRYG